MESIVVSEQEINNIEALLLSNNHQFASDAREVMWSRSTHRKRFIGYGFVLL